MPKNKQADFSAARKNMVDCQLMTNGITNGDIIESFSSVPREVFLPEAFLGGAYLDEDLKISNDAFLIEPVVHGRMLQLVAPRADENALILGDYTGYGAAVLSKMVSTVVTMEEGTGALDSARRQWEELDCCNIAIVSGVPGEGEPTHAPYNIIFMQGAVASDPEKALKQLDKGGRLVCVYRPDTKALGRICIYHKMNSGEISRQCYQDAATPYLVGFEPEEHFVF